MFNLFTDYPLLLVAQVKLHKAEQRQKVKHKLKKVIYSCVTLKQLVVAKRMFMQQIQAGNVTGQAIAFLDSVYADKLRELTK